VITFHIQPGELNRQVIVEQRSTTRGTMGEEIDSWTTYKRIWSKVLPIRGQEAAIARRETGKLETKFWFRYFSGLTLKMRLNMGGRYFDIVSIANLEERGRFLEVTAVETI